MESGVIWRCNLKGEGAQDWLIRVLVLAIVLSEGSTDRETAPNSRPLTCFGNIMFEHIKDV